MTSLRHKLTATVFISLLLTPWVAGAFGANSETVENRSKAPFPHIDAAGLVDPATFSAINDYVEDRVPLRGEATASVGRIGVALGLSNMSTVVEGPGDHLFLAEDFVEPCDQRWSVDQLKSALAGWDRAAEAGGKDWLFVVAPDKAAVLDHRLDGRAEVGAACGRARRAEFAELLRTSESTLDLWEPLRKMERVEPDSTYYTNDSHWTFAAGRRVAREMIERLAPGTWTDDAVTTSERTLRVRGDVAGRLGLDRAITVSVPHVALPGGVMTLDETDHDGTRTVRTYRSTGTEKLLPGRTVVLHDSMMNFVEPHLAPYFAEISFIHWNDVGRAAFFERAEAADRIIIEVVERNVHRRLADRMLMPAFSDDLSTALDPPPGDIEPLVGELAVVAQAVVAFEAEERRPASSIAELLEAAAGPDWTGPDIDGPVVRSGSHPRYGEWRLISPVDRTVEDGLVRCPAFEPQQGCATWVLLLGVPTAVVTELDLAIDGGDGLQRGDLRLSSPNQIVYFYSRPGSKFAAG